MVTFQWDDRKAVSNERKHGVNFFEAASVFDDPLAMSIADTEHSTMEEARFIIIGKSSTGRLVVVVYAHSVQESGDEVIRIISSRRATAAERKVYTNG